MKPIALVDCCPALVGADLSAADAERLAGLLKAVAEPARLRVLNLLAAAGEVCVCDLTEPLGLSQPTVSHHLKVLHDAGFTSKERRGKWVYHRLVRDRLDEVSGALAGQASATSSSSSSSK